MKKMSISDKLAPVGIENCNKQTHFAMHIETGLDERAAARLKLISRANFVVVNINYHCPKNWPLSL